MKIAGSALSRLCAAALVVAPAAIAVGGMPFGHARAQSAAGIRSEAAGRSRSETQAESAGRCVAGKIAFRTATDTVTTDLATGTPIPGTTVRFRSARKSCVLVRFSGAPSAPAGFGLSVSARLDGASVMGPGSVQFSADDAAAGHAHTFEFVLKGVPAGRHRVDIYWASPGSVTAYMSARNTVVQYR